MKGIILAGGKGTRLYPVTRSVSKSLVNAYNKPLIYYPLSVLMIAQIRDILIITTSEHLNSYKNLLKKGKDLGLNIQYEIQDKPNGIAESFIISERFIGSDDVCLILGDNIVYGNSLPEKLIAAKNEVTKNKNQVIFGYRVKNPTGFGVAEVDEKDNSVLSIEEKPAKPKSEWAVIGLYMYTNDVISVAKDIIPSARGELEITDVNKFYLNNKRLKIELLGRGFAWFDTGNCEDLFSASSFVRTIEKSQGFKIACIEEIAFRMGYIDIDQLFQFYSIQKNTEYGKYLYEIFHKEKGSL